VKKSFPILRSDNRIFSIILIVSLCCFYSFCLAQSSLESSIIKGKIIYENECLSCHQENGEGIMGAFPPLAKSDYFQDDISKAIDALLTGLEGELIVNGNTYYGVMDPVNLSNQEIADVLNYIQNSWGGKANELEVVDIENMR